MVKLFSMNTLYHCLFDNEETFNNPSEMESVIVLQPQLEEGQIGVREDEDLKKKGDLVEVIKKINMERTAR